MQVLFTALRYFLCRRSFFHIDGDVQRFGAVCSGPGDGSGTICGDL